MTKWQVYLTIVLASAPVRLVADLFQESFSTMPTGICLPDGYAIGAWQSVYNGYGCNAFVTWGGKTIVLERPASATGPAESHASLVIGPVSAGEMTLEVSSTTTRQLRTGSAPNPWEVAWVLWHYSDNVHFYYFVAKPNGWELGKADPAYPGAQRFLATGSSPSFPIGAWYRVRIAQSGATIQVFVNDLLMTTFTDEERPYSSGRVGLYSEDAEVYFDNVLVSTATAAPPARRSGNDGKENTGRPSIENHRTFCIDCGARVPAAAR